MSDSNPNEMIEAVLELDNKRVNFGKRTQFSPYSYEAAFNLVSLGTSEMQERLAVLALYVEQVLKNEGGVMLYRGAGYGVENHPFKDAPVILVKALPETVSTLRSHPYVDPFDIKPKRDINLIKSALNF